MYGIIQIFIFQKNRFLRKQSGNTVPELPAGLHGALVEQLSEHKFDLSEFTLILGLALRPNEDALWPVLPTKLILD